VGVERHRARTLRAREVADHDRRRIALLQHAHRETAPLEHAAQHLGVLLDPGAVAGDVREGEEANELVEDRALVRLPPRARLARGGRGARRGIRSGRGGGDTEREAEQRGEDA
jgi:hypothetical protein